MFSCCAALTRNHLSERIITYADRSRSCQSVGWSVGPFAHVHARAPRLFGNPSSSSSSLLPCNSSSIPGRCVCMCACTFVCFDLCEHLRASWRPTLVSRHCGALCGPFPEKIIKLYTRAHARMGHIKMRSVAAAAACRQWPSLMSKPNTQHTHTKKPPPENMLRWWRRRRRRRSSHSHFTVDRTNLW